MLPPLQPSGLPGLFKVQEELPPITPLAAEAEDNGAGWWRGDRPAAARPPAAGAAAAGAAGSSASILDALLVTMGEGGGPAPVRNAVALLAPGGPPAQRCPPGAPRRHAAPLPPPPEVPASVLAGLRPASAPPAPVQRYGNTRSGLLDTAASAPAPGASEAAAADALLQATAWMHHICRAQSSALP